MRNKNFAYRQKKQSKKKSVFLSILKYMFLFIFVFSVSFIMLWGGPEVFIQSIMVLASEPTVEIVTVPDQKILPLPEKPEVVFENGAHYVVYQDYKIIFANKNYKSSPEVGAEDPEARAALEEMMAALNAETGLEIYLVSGYRSYEEQDIIYHRFVEERGEEQADLISAQPGASEHQLGNTFDVLGTSADTGLSTRFADTPEFAWLIENCYKYGFILRYPEGKTFATTYSYEPWHYRYLGDVELAKDIMQSGLSFEEYFELVDIQEAG